MQFGTKPNLMAEYVLKDGAALAGKKRRGKRFQKFRRECAGREPEGPPHRVPDRFFHSHPGLIKL